MATEPVVDVAPPGAPQPSGRAQPDVTLDQLIDPERILSTLQDLGDLAHLPMGLYVVARGDERLPGTLRLVGPEPRFAAANADVAQQHAALERIAEVCHAAMLRGARRDGPSPDAQWNIVAWPLVVEPEDGPRALGCLVVGVPSGIRLGPDESADSRHGPEAPGRPSSESLPDVLSEDVIVLVHNLLGDLSADLSSQLSQTWYLRHILGRRRPDDVFELQALGADLQARIDQLPLEGTLLIDASGVIHGANETVRDWLRHPLMGLRCDEVCGSERVPCTACPRQTSFPRGEATRGIRRREVVWRHRVFVVSSYPVRTPDLPGETGTMVVLRDVTAQRRLEARYHAHAFELANERHRLAHILDSMGEGLLVTDGDGRIVLTNPAARALFGAGPRDLEGRHLLDLLPASAWLRDELDALRAGRVTRVVEEIRVPGARISDSLLSVAPMSAAGSGSEGWVVTLRDITPLKQADRMRDEFFSNVSHELRTPIATLRGVALTMLEDAEMTLVDRIDFLRIIDREAQRLGTLIEDMLAMTRLEAGRAKPHTRVIDARLAVHELHQFFAPLCRELAITLAVETPEDAVPVHADPGLLAQLMHNLAGHSLRFIHSGGHLAVTLTLERADAALLRLVDDGPGHPERERPHLFERFYHSRHAARVVPGAGLGLPIVKRIADAHGWRISLAPAQGTGTAVELRLPLAAPEDDDA